MKCDRCGYPGVYHPVKPVTVGHSRGKPVVQYLCAVCADHVRRRLTVKENKHGNWGTVCGELAVE